MAKSDKTEFYEITQTDSSTDPNIFENVFKESDLELSLSSLGLNQNQIDILLKQGEKYLEKPGILSIKLKISEELARRALEVLKSSKQISKLIITPEDIRKIETCLKENPKVLSHEDIALITEVDEELVSMYFDKLPLNGKQKEIIEDEYDMGHSVEDISTLLNVKKEKVTDYVETKFVTFSGEKGKLVFGIITKYCGEMSISNLRQKIKCKNLKLQDKLYCMLRSENQSEYKIIEGYFSEHEESKDFLKVDMNLTLDDILILKQGSKDSVEQLSVMLNKVESIIIGYFRQYLVQSVEKKYFTELQEKRITNSSKAFETKKFSLEDYRTIVTYSFNDVINHFDGKKNTEKSQDLLMELLPFVFNYLKCSLPLEDITQVIASASGVVFTTHDIFHIIFQLSDPVLRGLCIEHYSFSNPVPLYYPKLRHPESESRSVEFEICKELWYCLEQYNGLISFGLGRASWNAVGKSSLLDLIFETDFVKGNPQSSAFHFGSIDIQLTRNLFGKTEKPNCNKWAYIDCHCYSDFGLIQAMCSHLDIALIHVCYNDYIRNKDQLDRELSLFKMKHVYIVIRDCECSEVTVELKQVNGVSQVYVFIPNLTETNSLPSSIVKSLKEIGHEIIHLSIESLKLIQSEFIYKILQNLNSPALEGIFLDSIRIGNITRLIMESLKAEFSCLNYYPLFVKYMSQHHHKFACGISQEMTKFNSDCEKLAEKLKRVPMSDIIYNLNIILNQENSILILCKLSQELSKMHTKERNEDKITQIYTLEILWRECILFYKYAPTLCKNPFYQHYKDLFVLNYCKSVGNGEAFELIDGDNLKFFNQEIDSLLKQYYENENNLLKNKNKDQTIKINSAPIVVSIIGPQNSGKSTLLNYCFGCKFLTSAGRCTRGIYGSLSKLDRPVNLSQSFLILDTEGLDAIERENIKDSSMIHFDRTMVLFCLSVSQVVIINMRGDIGSEMQNLLQICAYSLNRLKVSKVKAPKIFFVLNQQADPDPDKHIDTINLLMEKLNSETELLETDGVKISDLIQVSRENLFILPSAFNSEKMNTPIAKLFDSDIIKLSPTIAFADKCTNLRLAIINQLDHMPSDDRAPFQTMSEWMKMAGVIWDTITKYQDIVKYRNVEELKCSNQLEQIVTDLMERHFYSNQGEFRKLSKEICAEAKFIMFYVKPDIILAEKMVKFDELFGTFQDLCLKEFPQICQNDQLLRRMEPICNDNLSNIKRLIYVVRKQYEDQILLQIKSIITEIELSESIKKFQSILKENMEKYRTSNNMELKVVFEEIWMESFGIDDHEEESRECEENFNTLYSMFKMEYNAMENKQSIFQLFRNYNFKMETLIESFENDILTRFHDQTTDQTVQFISTLNVNHAPIKDMVPYRGRAKFSYLSQKSLYERSLYNKLIPFVKISPYVWIPSQCEGLLQYCSGYYSHPDIIWNPNKATQVNILKSFLVDPEDLETSTWKKFIRDISLDVLKNLVSDSEVSPAVVKKIVHALCLRIKLLNYEIGFIHAGLSNTAERSLSTFVFAYVFKFLWQTKTEFRQENKEKKEIKKTELFGYFSQKIEENKMLLGEWD